MPRYGSNEENSQWGQFAENIAMELLMRKGYAICERNWSPPHSHLEIDVIASKDDEVVFVEVKARSGNSEGALDAVTSAKMRNIINAARNYMSHTIGNLSYRFDIIAVTGIPQNYTVEHIEDAYLPPLSSR